MAKALPAGALPPAKPVGWPNWVHDPKSNPLPPEVLAFPEWSEHYREKILAGNFVIWSAEKLQRFASAQHFSVTEDQPGAGLKYKRAAVVSPPGLSFRLKRPITEKGSAFHNGWVLFLDIAALRARDGVGPPQAYQNILECEVLIDGVLFHTIRQGAQAQSPSPVKIAIPHIHDPDGNVIVELRLANHPRNFLFLYDAYLAR
ncbi:MAG: hypothetical protein ONA90_01175 [candidate division KSB1 bacterium]|nr:hypothetical protein [candidate division KSB1 bacterium]